MPVWSAPSRASPNEGRGYLASRVTMARVAAQFARCARAAVRAILCVMLVAASHAALAGAASAEGRRIALLVGNAAYSSDVGALVNPANDVAAVRLALIAAGFKSGDIRAVSNTTRVQLKREVDDFAARAAALGPTDVAFFYYAGHGAVRSGFSGLNLIPVDAASPESTDFWYATLDLEREVLSVFRASGSDAVWIIAIDACRNELRLPVRALGGGDRAFSVVPSSSGMLISFAADDGETARDILPGASNSPYALALVEALKERGERVSSVFGSIRPRVISRTQGAQRPVVTNKLNFDPVLVAAIVIAPAAPTFGAALPEPAAPCSIQPSPFIVYFEYDRADLSASGSELIGAALQRARSGGCQIHRVEIEGHTDSVGSAAYNARLSARMADSVSRLLVANGVDATFVTTIAKGESEPAKPGPDGVREPLNRRVVVELMIGPPP